MQSSPRSMNNLTSFGYRSISSLTVMSLMENDSKIISFYQYLNQYRFSIGVETKGFKISLFDTIENESSLVETICLCAGTNKEIFLKR
ncbi:conserved hypothetical protein [Desulforapulum autotrophicum HRM2]|uniref:Uncharacterized protein n=1 Tax=Desulforapulum autotrophicum (strain ATCC 43914 / DSM 3382 / VKM B-1955 / HRM2) TaxID=177437 RepID=C0QE91_DESAH|nr:conserved hypothetical protein [Desulforapulum autotrophicum HRM2]